jgi:CheY-like chemotaxis protein
MSHELRTPLNAILGFSQLMMMNPNQNIEKRKSNIDHIYQAGSHLLELVDEVLDLSKIESGQFSLTEENLNASLIIKELIAQIQPLAKENKVEIVNHLSQQDDHFVEADHKSFAQIMLNLLSNGIKYNKEDGSIAVDGGVLSKDKIWISVSDNGLGVSNKNIEKLFEPFERLGQEYGEVHGTGIGLSISKSLAELMGGSLSAECELGKGCSFKIVLPVGKREPVNMTTPDSGSATLKIDIQSKSHTILYIEDNRKNLILIEKILETRAQIKFLPAMHPREGIELARTHRPDLILMDMQLPDMDGTAAFRELQKFQETCAIPVIAVSAQAMESDIKKALDIGFKDYITKPIDVPKLLNTIDEVFA